MLCGRAQCPLLMKIKIREKLKTTLVNGRELLGESPSVFIGYYGYPKVFIGPLAGKELVLSDETSSWFGLPIEKILEHRLNLFRGKQAVPINSAKNPGRELEAMQEIAMSEKNVSTDVIFKKEPRIEANFSDSAAPYGPSADTSLVKLESNPKIPRAVDAVVNDELKSAEGMKILYEKGIAVDKIQSVLSAGLLGIDKKLVPTRWSITATDDQLGKHLLEKLRGYGTIDDYFLFSSDYLGNHFEILLAPGNWAFEQIEYYKPRSKSETPAIAADFERYQGRKKYAEIVAGGYYAGRLAVCEYLERTKKQATAIIVREIGPEYYAPVGVWQVRENARDAMRSAPAKFSSLETALEEVGRRFFAGKIWEKKSEALALLKSRSLWNKYL
ncbi:MAG: Nre family DNA repair protein [Candidatus Micrarchaeota archaeon]